MKTRILRSITDKRQRGSALVMAMFIVTLLFVLGTAFLMNSRVDVHTADSVDSIQLQKAAVEAVIERINEILLEDVVVRVRGGGSTVLSANESNLAQNEGYDYPYTRIFSGIDNIYGTTDDRVAPAGYPGPDGIGGTQDDGRVDAGPDGNWGTADDIYYQSSACGYIDDQWLATLEPEMVDVNETPGIPGDDIEGFRHISDIYGYFDGSNNDHSVARMFEANLRDQNIDQLGNAYHDRVSFRNMRAGIINDTAPILQVGDKADADGDGVADSRWVAIPDDNLVGLKDENIYTAVRIVDNGGMINMNTAWRNPMRDVASGVPSLPYNGTRLSDVNLDYNVADNANYWGILADPADTMLALMRNRGWFNATIDNINSQDFNDEFCRRFFNPARPPSGNFYLPFTIDDEMSLRYRYLVNSPAASRMDYAWPNTLAGYPTKFTKGGQMSNWFNLSTAGWTPGNATTWNGFYNRRHLLTTYNADRVMVSKFSKDVYEGAPAFRDGLLEDWNRYNDSNKNEVKPVEVGAVGRETNNAALDNRLKQLAAAIWLGLDDPASNRAPSGFGGRPAGTDTTYNNNEWNIEKLDLACQLAVNLADYVDNGSNETRLEIDLGGDKQIYWGFESKASRVYISELVRGTYQPEDPLAAPVQFYAIQIFNPTNQLVKMENWQLKIGDKTTYRFRPLTIPARSSRLVGDSSDAGVEDVIQGLLLDASDPISDKCLDTPLIYNINEWITLLKPVTIDSKTEYMPIDQIYTHDVGSLKPGPATRILRTLRRGDWVIGDPAIDDGGLPIWETNEKNWQDVFGGMPSYQFTPNFSLSSINPPPVNFPRVRFWCRDDNAFQSIAELSLVLGVGARDYKGDRFWTIPERLNAFVSRTGAPGSPRQDINSYLAARPNIQHPDWINLARFLVADNFDPFEDVVRGSNPPISIDNDGDGRANEADELAIVGRININTAPWFVIAQLPWMQDPMLANDSVDKFKLANAITSWRDKTNMRLVNSLGDTTTPAPEYGYGDPAFANWVALNPDGTQATDLIQIGQAWTKTRTYGMGLSQISRTVNENPGFRSVYELLNVTNNQPAMQTCVSTTQYDAYDIQRYGKDLDPADLSIARVNSETLYNNASAPNPFQGADTGVDDVNERNILFRRIANLVTTRSDVFTAYIVVRIGEAGPQKRVMCIFDRSNVFQPTDKPRLLAYQEVLDMR